MVRARAQCHSFLCGVFAANTVEKRKRLRMIGRIFYLAGQSLLVL